MSTATVDLDSVPPLTAPDRWVSVTPAEGPRTSEHRHIVTEGSATSLCGVTALPMEMWRVDRRKPYCPSCVKHRLTGETHSSRRDGRYVIQRRRSYRGNEVTETYYPSDAEKSASQRDTIRKHVPGEHAEAVIALVEAGVLSVREVSGNVDKDGFYEDSRGSCVRDSDEASCRTVTGLRFATGWYEIDGTVFQTERQKAQNASCPETSEPEPEDGEF